MELIYLFTVLQKAFDSFAQGKGYITPEMVGTILRIMGQPFVEQTLRELIAEVDEDGKGPEMCLNVFV